MAFDVAEARKAGYSIQEIGNFVGFDVDSALKSGYSEDEIIGHLQASEQKTPSAEVPEQEKGFISQSASDVGRRMKNIGGIIDRPNEYDLASHPEKSIEIAGQVAGAFNDVVGNAITGVYKKVVPEYAKGVIEEGVGYWAKKPVVQETAKAISDKWKGFAEENPSAARLAEAGGNIAMAVPTAKLLKGGLKETVAMGKDIKKAVFPTVKETLDREIKKEVSLGLSKGIRPSVSGKQNFTQAKQYFEKGQDAVETIIKNKGNLSFLDDGGNIVKGQVPENLNQFSQAIEQTKKQIFSMYDDMAKATGAEGISVDLGNIGKELDAIKSSKAIQMVDPSLIDYVDDLAVRFSGRLTPNEAQEVIAHLNERLKAFYRNPSYDTATRATIDSLVANNIRKALDTAVEKTVGSGYQKLKNTYGSLRAIENDIAKRMIVDARKNIKGLLDFSDVFSGYHAVEGILRFNPQIMASSAASKLLASAYRKMNDPNHIIKKMFSSVEKKMEQRAKVGKPFQGESMIGKALTPEMPPNIEEILKKAKDITPEEALAELERRRGQ